MGWCSIFPAYSNQPFDIEQLIQRAHSLELANQDEWANLLHYKHHAFGGFYSQADDRKFFLAENGKYDLRAELEADLRAFFEVKESQHAQCRFPARLYWLNERLGFSKKLPEVNCPKFDAWVEKLNAYKVTMLFPAMYLNNPGSMFGHTFLRFDAKNKSPLLSFTLSYAAEFDVSDNGLVYVYKGISGGYPGVFSVRPYYETVNEYGDIEHRDIWEYELNLSEQETKQLVRHVWEVMGIKFDYFFLRENCSYRLLSLLDVARPGMNMTKDAHPVYAIPVDTVRTTEKANLISAETYRPALNSRLEKMYAQLDEEARVTAFNLAEDKQQSLDKFENVEKAKIYEFANELVSESNKKLSHKLLLERSKVSLSAQQTGFEFKGVKPETSHLSARWQLALGEIENQDFLEIGIRPSFHDLLDPEKGFVKGAAISALDMQLRWNEDNERLKLNQLTIFNMTSLSPIKPWSTPVSWRFNVEINRRRFLSANDSKVFSLSGDLGYSIEIAKSLFYVLGEFDVHASKKLDHHYAMYAGFESGMLYWFEQSRFNIAINSVTSFSGQEDSRKIYRLQYQYDIAKNQGLRLAYEKLKDDFVEEKTWKLSYLFYF